MKPNKEDVRKFIKERAMEIAKKAKIDDYNKLDGSWQAALAWKFHNIYLESIDKFTQSEWEFIPPGAVDGGPPVGAKGGVRIGGYDDVSHLTPAELEEIFLEVVEKDCIGESLNFTRVLASQACRLGLFYKGIKEVNIDNEAWLAGQQSEKAARAAKKRWQDDPKKEAYCLAYKAWKGAKKEGQYKAKLARNMINNGPGIKDVLVDPKGLAEKFGKWEREEDLPEC